ncbi:hypothetical protein C5167_021290 [Papaver somniferum]|uniref:Uncharacterized protein n=1 Tax=Papaver somniferum TaxID=3469 RepID=A0A4Y7IZE4_PAPSO|nr:hypothetical protein C5167_021290 [Papaver somniferum]
MSFMRLSLSSRVSLGDNLTPLRETEDMLDESKGTHIPEVNIKCPELGGYHCHQGYESVISALRETEDMLDESKGTHIPEVNIKCPVLNLSVSKIYSLICDGFLENFLEDLAPSIFNFSVAGGLE